jgi:hypothetical protein
VLPRLDAGEMELVRSQLEVLEGRHELVEEDGEPGLELLAAKGVEPSMMGRGLAEAREAFLAAAAAGRAAARALS